jgi:hypothetical protein
MFGTGKHLRRNQFFRLLYYSIKRFFLKSIWFGSSDSSAEANDRVGAPSNRP